jgi:SlyX protein
MSDLPDKIIRLETTIAHLERELEQMHSVLLDVQAELKSSREKVARLETKLELVIEPAEERDPGDERPPHY